jgi:hypothetical protein
MAGVGVSMGAHGELTGEGKEGERGGERSKGAQLGVLLEAPWGGAARSNSLLVAALRVFCFLRDKKKTARRRREEREEKKKKRKKTEKWEKYVNMEISRKIR